MWRASSIVSNRAVDFEPMAFQATICISRSNAKVSDSRVLWSQSPNARFQAALTVRVEIRGGGRGIALKQNWQEGVQALLKTLFGGCLLPLDEQLLACRTVQEAGGNLPAAI